MDGCQIDSNYVEISGSKTFLLCVRVWSLGFHGKVFPDVHILSKYILYSYSGGGTTLEMSTVKYEILRQDYIGDFLSPPIYGQGKEEYNPEKKKRKNEKLRLETHSRHLPHLPFRKPPWQIDRPTHLIWISCLLPYDDPLVLDNHLGIRFPMLLR